MHRVWAPGMEAWMPLCQITQFRWTLLAEGPEVFQYTRLAGMRCHLPTWKTSLFPFLSSTSISHQNRTHFAYVKKKVIIGVLCTICLVLIPAQSVQQWSWTCSIVCALTRPTKLLKVVYSYILKWCVIHKYYYFYLSYAVLFFWPLFHWTLTCQVPLSTLFPAPRPFWG